MGFVEVENCTLDKKIICIAKCQKDAKCNQAIFNIGTKNCFLNSYYLSNPDILTIESKLYEKINTPKSQNECLRNTEYWSKKINSCLPCPDCFFRSSNYAFACFHDPGFYKNFIDPKKYCEELGSFLPRPNSPIERQTIGSFDTSKYIWVDSFVTRVGQQYKWGDGSSIVGYIRINNYGGSSTKLKQDSLALLVSDIYDNESLSNSKGVCQIA